MAANKTVGKNRNTTDTTDTGTTGLNNSTATTIQAANKMRIFFHVNNNDSTKDFWVRLYPASQDNIKQGIFVTSKTGAKPFWEMPIDNIYTGEISAIADTDSPTAYTTEY